MPHTQPNHTSKENGNITVWCLLQKFTSLPKNKDQEALVQCHEFFFVNLKTSLKQAMEQVVPTTGPPKTWPISISAHLLAPFPDPTMHNMYICHKSQAVWENARWGRGVCAFGHSGTALHPLGRQMVYPQTCSNPAALQNFSCSCIMIWWCEAD